MSTPISYEVRQQMLDIRQSLERLEGEQKSIERTLEKHPDAAYLSHQIPAIEARRSELAAELAELQAEAVTLATPLDPALSVAETEQHLQKLLALAAEADSELAAVRARLPKFRSTYQAAVLSDEDMGAAFSELESARLAEAELVSRSKIIRDAITGSEFDLERAKTARGERERQHWAKISTKLSGIERWCCLIRAHARPGVIVDWNPAWGNKPTPDERVACMERLAQKYPFKDEGE